MQLISLNVISNPSIDDWSGSTGHIIKSENWNAAITD